MCQLIVTKMIKITKGMNFWSWNYKMFTKRIKVSRQVWLGLMVDFKLVGDLVLFLKCNLKFTYEILNYHGLLFGCKN
jgi:hypothetical protein